jgi:hypothetical protein
VEFPPLNIDLDKSNLFVRGNHFVKGDYAHANRGDLSVRPIIKPVSQTAVGRIIFHELKLRFAASIANRRLMHDHLRETLGKLLRKLGERFESVMPSPRGDIDYVVENISQMSTQIDTI